MANSKDQKDQIDAFAHMQEFLESMARFAPDMQSQLMKGYSPEIDLLLERQAQMTNPAFWMQMGHLSATHTAAMPWIWYAMMLSSMEAMSGLGEKSKKVKKRHKQAKRAIKKFTKHVAGSHAVKAPKGEPADTKQPKKAKTHTATQLSASKPKAEKKPAKTSAGLANSVSAPKGGKADNLRMISGVGPKIEGILHELGIYHFDQIAQWSPKEVKWVDDHLRFSGRITRENWIAQAKVLAEGGREAYVKVFGKEPV